ncbi:MAG: hypothetical protein ACTSXK_14855 [Promethearchaeota archaeon]
MKNHIKLRTIFTIILFILILNNINVVISNEANNDHNNPSSSAETDLTWNYWTDISGGNSSNVVFNYETYNDQSNVLQINQKKTDSDELAAAKGTFPASLSQSSIEFEVALGSHSGSFITMFARNANGDLLFGVRMHPDNRIMIYDCQSKSYPYSVEDSTTWVHFRIEFDSSNQRYDIYCNQNKIASNLLYYSYYASSDTNAVDMVVYTNPGCPEDYSGYINNVILGSEREIPTTSSTFPYTGEPTYTDMTSSENSLEYILNVLPYLLGAIVIVGLIGAVIIIGKKKEKSPQPVVLVAQSVVEKHYITGISQNINKDGFQGQSDKNASIPSIYCQYCGFENFNSNIYCNNCGFKLHEE